MEIEKIVTVTITPNELREILKDFLKTKCVDVESIYFDVQGHNQEGDWRAEFPLSYDLDQIICKGKEI